MNKNGNIKNLTKGCIYYTDCRLEGTKIVEESRKSILASGLPIVSCSLRPIDFGKNIVLEGLVRSYPTYVKQILTALKELDTEYVFFTEHDVLYHPSHFDFIPERDDVYYYNVNNFRWWIGAPTAISYDGLTSLSGLCCNRELAIEHYKLRMELIEKEGLDKFRSREPRMARIFGYEPGTKKRRKGGVSDEEHVKRKSEFPNIDIRHHKTFSAPKITLDSFKHKPENWRELNINSIPGWNLASLFPQETKNFLPEPFSQY
jgi:hypothetical protein